MNNNLVNRIRAIRLKIFGNWPTEPGKTDERDLERMSTDLAETAHKFEQAAKAKNYVGMFSALSRLDYLVAVTYGELGGADLQESLIGAYVDHLERTQGHGTAGPDVAAILDSLTLKRQPGKSQIADYLRDEFNKVLAEVKEYYEQAEKSESANEGLELFIKAINRLKDLKNTVTKVLSNYVNKEIDEMRLFEKTESCLSEIRMPDDLLREIRGFVFRLNGQMSIALTKMQSYKI